MGLKKLYYNLEDRYYNFVERTGLYKITDKIDKVMPSFILFILLILIIIAGIVLLLLPKGTANTIDIQFKVIDAESGAFLEDTSVMVTTTQGISTYLTDSSGLTEKIKVPRNSSYEVKIQKDGYQEYENFYFSQEISETITIALEPISVTPPTVRYTFSVVDAQTGEVINRNGNISYKCLNNVLAPNSQSLSNGNVTVDANPACQLMIDSISFNGYLSRYNVAITNGTLKIELQQDDIDFGPPGSYNLSFNIKNSSNEPLSNIKVALSNSYGLVDSCLTSTAGTCNILDVVKGDYTVTYTDMRSVPLYSSKTEMLFVTENLTKNVVLSSDVSGYIYVKILGQGNRVVEDAEVSLKNAINETLQTKLSDVNGFVIFTVPEIKDYNVVVDAEGYLIERKLIKAIETMPTNPTLINLRVITPETLAPLNVRVLGWDGRGYKFAKVILYDADTGFLSDYKPVVTNYDGNAVYNISSGRYIAKAVKGNNVSEEIEFEFNVKFPEATGTVILPMGISEGTLSVRVIDKEKNPVSYARVDLYDRYSYYSNFPAIPIRSIDTDSDGRVEFNLDADVDYYVVASPLIDGDFGKTQSRFVRLSRDVVTELEVTLFNFNSALTKPRIEKIGIFRDGLEIKDNLKAGEDYEVRYYLSVPQNRTGNDVFEEIGFILRTGSTSMIENDALFIKYLDVPYLDSIQKYTQFNMTPPHETEGRYDADSLTESDFKWAKATLKQGPLEVTGPLGYYNVYEVSAIISVKDTAVFGEELKLFSLGYGLTKEGAYETFNPYFGENNLIEYYDVYNTDTYGVGDELFCSTDFCLTSTIIDISEDLRYDVSDNFGAKPNKDYKYSFTLINNSNETRYITSRFILENLDEGLDIKSIRIVKPNGEVFLQNNPSEYRFDIPISELTSRQKVTGEVVFTPKLKGTRNLSIRFISDQRTRFVNQLFIEVASEKTFEVSVEPQIIPSGKNFDLVVKAKDFQTKLPVKDTTVTIKDKFKDTIRGPVNMPITGEITISNIPAQAVNDKVYIYITAPEYETLIKEITTTDRLFTITPRTLAYSLNVFEEKQRTETFTINNISPIDLTIESLEVKGTGLEIIDILRINNDLLNSAGIVIKGLDTISEVPDNTDSSKQIPLTISLNPRSEAIRELQNLSATLKIVLKSGNSSWVTELPIRVNVGFDGMLQNSNCLSLSDGFWKEISLNNPVETQFMITNNCSINNTRMPLSNGLDARVVFDSNPQGKFLITIDNKFIELTHGNYRNLLSTVDRDRSYPIILRYEPVGRMKGKVTGKIQFRSLNSTGTGEQEILSEFNFEIDVTNLRDCVVFSKSTLNVGQGVDEFTIENKGCPIDTVYRISCDDCAGLVIEPRNNIEVSSTGTSDPIIVRNMGAIPGAYILNVYSEMDVSRQTERPIKQIKAYVRPTDYCIDLERYEFDLYRSEYSENTGLTLPASSYDVTNIINLCYGQEVYGQFTVRNDAKWKLAAASFFRDGLYTGVISGILQGKLFGANLNKQLESSTELLDKAERALTIDGLSDTRKNVLNTLVDRVKTAKDGDDAKAIKEANKALEEELKRSEYNSLNATPEDETPDDETPDDETPEDETPEDETSEDETS